MKIWHDIPFSDPPPGYDPEVLIRMIQSSIRLSEQVQSEVVAKAAKDWRKKFQYHQDHIDALKLVLKLMEVG
jgi:hypothetical protein